jgi:hypothetical protein
MCCKMPSLPAADALRRAGRMWRTLAPLPFQQHAFRAGTELRRHLWRPLLRYGVAWVDRQAVPPVDTAALAALGAVVRSAGLPRRPVVSSDACALGGTAFAGLASLVPCLPKWSPLAVYEAHYLEWLQTALTTEGLRDEAVAAWQAWRSASRTQLQHAVWRKAWEPYPRARRVLACLRAASVEAAGSALQQDLLAEAYSAAYGLSWLAERHLDGNHLLADRVAEAAASAAWGGPAGVRERARCEAERQFAADGGHVEGSPMYHAVCLEDLLTVVPLLPAAEARTWQPLLARATQWLARLRHPDGSLPAFGDTDADALQGLPLATAALADRGDWPGPPAMAAEELSAWVAGNRLDRVVVHTAAVVWPNQPGHAHDDALSLEVSLGGVRWLADAGLGGYDGDPHRALCRSRASHSTVDVAGRPAMELWGAFRVGARGLVRDIERGRGCVVTRRGHGSSDCRTASRHRRWRTATWGRALCRGSERSVGDRTGAAVPPPPARRGRRRAALRRGHHASLGRIGRHRLAGAATVATAVAATRVQSRGLSAAAEVRSAFSRCSNRKAVIAGGDGQVLRRPTTNLLRPCVGPWRWWHRRGSAGLGLGGPRIAGEHGQLLGCPLDLVPVAGPLRGCAQPQQRRPPRCRLDLLFSAFA